VIAQYLPIKLVCEKLSISDDTLRKLVQQKEITTVRFGRNVRIPEASVVAFIERHTARGKA
jgi:excisionase family DNA binding protein